MWVCMYFTTSSIPPGYSGRSFNMAWISLPEVFTLEYNNMVESTTTREVSIGRVEYSFVSVFCRRLMQPVERRQMAIKNTIQLLIGKTICENKGILKTYNIRKKLYINFLGIIYIFTLITSEESRTASLMSASRNSVMSIIICFLSVNSTS